MKKEYTGKKNSRTAGTKNVSRSGSRPTGAGSSRRNSSRPSTGRPARKSSGFSEQGESPSFRREGRPSGTGAPRRDSGRSGTGTGVSRRVASKLVVRPVRRSAESSEQREDNSFRRESRPSSDTRRPGTGAPRRDSGRPGAPRRDAGRPGTGAPRRDAGKPVAARPVRKSSEFSEQGEDSSFRREGRPSSDARRPGTPRRDSGRPGAPRRDAGRPGTGAPRRDAGKPVAARPVRKSSEFSEQGEDSSFRREGRPSSDTRRPGTGTGAPRRDAGKPVAARPVRRSAESPEQEERIPLRLKQSESPAVKPAPRKPEQTEGLRPVRKRSESTRTSSTSRGGRSPRREEQPERLDKRSAGRTKARGNTPRVEEEADLRLNKFLADSGIASRRKADELIQQGVVKVNQETVTEPGTKVHLSDLVTVRGEPVNAEKHLTYILLNKPKGYITTTSDEKGRKTVMDIVRSRERIFPVGRLDRNTSGVLLFTNDGEMANHLMHPRYEVPRVYNVTLNKYLLMEDARKIAAGVELEDGKTQPCSIVIDPQKKNKVTLEITEGKNREVRRIFESLGYDVEKLDRKVYAGLTTRGMKRGEFRHLTRQEVRELEELLSLKNRSTSTSQAGSGRRRPVGKGRRRKY